MTQTEYELLILRTIRAILFQWVGAVLLVCTLYAAPVYGGVLEIFELTDFVKDSTFWVITAVFVLFAFSYLLTGKENTVITWQFRIQIVIALVILALVVFISGGLLDSPFTGAIAFFVGSFISLQTDAKVKESLKRFNLALVTGSVVLLVLPYIVSHALYGDASFVSWKFGSWISYMRIGITILLLIMTGYAASQINRELSMIELNVEGRQ